jgi:hypothetical protein
VIDAVGATPEAPADVPARVSRVWRILAIVVTFQVLAIVGAILLFSSLGLGYDGVGSCGGG